MSREIEVKWGKLFDEFMESGKTQRQFCKENSLVLCVEHFQQKFANQNKTTN